MRIAFNPSTVAALTTPPNNKDITFDLKGRNIFARGVKFYGTDTNTWRPVVDNLTSNSTTSSLSANQGRVLKALIDGKSDSGHNHDGRYVRYYAVTTLDCNNLAAGLTAARVSATNAAHTNNSVYLYISDIGTPFQIQIPDSNVPYIYKRYYSSGKWSGWFKLNAGYADSAGSVAWANITGKPSSYTPSAHTHAWNSLTHSSTTENQAILTNGKANGWKLYTLNISGWNNAANNAHSHANKSVLDGITSGLVSNWNTAYNFVHTITGTDTDNVINKWDEIVNFLAGITEDNKLNTLLNSKLSIQQLAANDILTTKTNNALFWVNTVGTAGNIPTGPFTDHPYALLSVTNYNQNDTNGKFFYRSRLAFSSIGDIKVASCHHQNEYKQDETWYNVLTSKNSGISGSTIKLNGTSITVYSSGTTDGRYVKKSGDTMTGVLTIDTTNFGTLTIKRNDDANGASIQFRGKSSVYGYIGLNNSTKDKQFLRWNSDISKVYTILDTSSTYTSSGKGVINGTTITQVDNATNATNSTNARKLVNWYSSRPTSLNAQFGDGSLRIFHATSSTTEGKPAEDSHILHLAWDNTGGWDAQLAVHTRSGKVSTRAQSSGTWQPWKTLALTSEIPNKNSWNYDDRYYTKAESNAKYITDISTSVNKLTFTKNGSNIDRTITVNNVQSLGRRSPLTERNAISGIYTYGTYSKENNLAPANYFETLGFGEGTAGTIEIGGSWISNGQLYWRALRDVSDNWFSWKTILDSSNYSGILDSRYYTESEVNSLLSKKLDRVNLTTGSWNPRGYSLAADYNYSGGDISLSVNGGQMHVSVDGKFWQNEGQYRVLDTSDITSIRGGLTLYQYLSSTDNNWFPLVWGGSNHKNTNNSTGSLYKSHDKLSWQTSSQTLYATNIRTENIKNLSIGGGIYWNPYVESATDGSDAASITVVKSGVAGGTTLVLSQMNDSNDTIQFKTSTAARLYHNGNQILTSGDTKVSSGKGYINNTEITQVNNSDTLDGWHKDNIQGTGYITSSNSLTSYWFKMYDITVTGYQYNDITITFLVSEGYTAHFSIFHLRIRQNGTNNSGNYNLGVTLRELVGNLRDKVVAYYNNSTGNVQLWGNTDSQWGTMNYTIIKKTTRTATDSSSLGTLTAQGFSSVQTPPSTGYTKLTMSRVGSVSYSDSTGSVHWNNVTNKPSTFNPAAHTHTWASITDKIVAGNEFNIVNAGFKESIWFNYLPINDRNKTAAVASYIMGNGAKGYASVQASGFIKSGGNVSQLLRADGGVAAFNWSGQSGQPTWLWGGNSQHSYYVYNPSNFRVAYAASAGNADTLDGEHANSFVRAGAIDADKTDLNALDTYSFIKSVNSEVADHSPKRNTGWYNVIQLVHRNGAGDGASYIGQIALGMTTNTDDMFFRGKRTDSWKTVIHSGNIGSQTVAYANNSDTVDGYHANGLFTAFGNNGHNITATIGGVTKEFLVNYAADSDKLDGKHASDFASAGHNHNSLYLRLDGSNTMTGVLNVKASQFNDAYDGAINMNNSDIYGLNSIYTSDRSDSQAEGIHFWRDATHVDTLRMMDGKLLFTPYRPLGDSGTEQTVLHTGNSSVSGQTITINGTSTTWSNTQRPLGTGSGDAAAGNHTHKVKINGSEKTIAATGVTDLGTYLTSQSLRGYVHAYNNTGTGNAVTSISIEGGTITANKGTTFLTSHQSLANYYTKGQVDTKLGKYLPLAGGTMDAGAQIQRTAKGGMWYQGRSLALLRETSANGYHALWSLKTTDGSWDFGEYNSSGWNNIPVLSYVLDSNFDKNSNATTYQIKFPLASGTIALTSNIPNPTDYYWANNKITSSSKIDAQVRVSSLGAGCLTTIANTVMATNWLRATGSTGIYFQDHAGGLYMSDDTWIRTYNSKALQVDNTIRSKDFNTTYIDSNSKWTITSAAKLENSTTLVYGQSTTSNSINSYLRGTTVTIQVKKGTTTNYSALQLTSDYIYCNNYCDMKYGAAVSGGNFTVNNNSYLAQKANTKVGIGTSDPQYMLDVNGSAKIKNLRLKASNMEFYLQPVCVEFVKYIARENRARSIHGVRVEKIERGYHIWLSTSYSALDSAVFLSECDNTTVTAMIATANPMVISVTCPATSTWSGDFTFIVVGFPS